MANNVKSIILKFGQVYSYHKFTPVRLINAMPPSGD